MDVHILSFTQTPFCQKAIFISILQLQTDSVIITISPILLQDRKFKIDYKKGAVF